MVADLFDDRLLAVDRQQGKLAVHDAAEGRQSLSTAFDSLFVRVGFLKRRPFVPGVGIGDALVAEENAAVMGVISLGLRLVRQVLHRVGACHRLAGGAENWPEIGLVGLVDDVSGEWPTCHLDRHAVPILPQGKPMRRRGTGRWLAGDDRDRVDNRPAEQAARRDQQS